jgi:hypothetical protein
LLRSRRNSRTDSTTGLTILLAAGLGAGAMYLLDPSRGRRRRRLIADKVNRAVHQASDSIETTGRHLTNRARRLAAAARRSVTVDDAEEAVICERVRAALGRVVSNSGAIEVDVDEGTVFLWGDIPAEEATELLECVAAVRGVRSVEDRLTRHVSASDRSGLNGSSDLESGIEPRIPPTAADGTASG